MEKESKNLRKITKEIQELITKIFCQPHFSFINHFQNYQIAKYKFDQLEACLKKLSEILENFKLNRL